MLDNKGYLLLFRGNYGYANAPHVYSYIACLVNNDERRLEAGLKKAKEGGLS
jgi:hypothetical protein